MNLKIINIAANSKNNKDIKNHTHYSKLKNSICGDEIQIKLIIKEDKIVNFGYQTTSCIYCQASASLLSMISINSKKDKIVKLCDDAKLFFSKDKKNFNDNINFSLINKIGSSIFYKKLDKDKVYKILQNI